MGLESKFRELREAWFYRVLPSYPQERVWETEEEESIRKDYNRRLKQRYDEDTEKIIDGQTACVAPECQHDMD